MTNSIRTWMLLSSRGRGALVEAVIALAAARLMVVLRPFKEVAAAAARQPRRTSREPDAMRREVSWAITAAARRAPWRALCLEQAIAAQAMLRRRGVASVLHYGVKAGGGDLAAHAWVTVEGRDVVGGPASVGFVEMTRFQAESPS